MAAGGWKGHLRLSLVSCPVRLSPAFSESTRIHLHLLNGKTQNRVHQFLRDAETDKEVAREDTVRGYEYDKDRYVVLDDADLDKAQGSLESAHIIDLDRFVADDEVDDIYFDSPYWVVPDGRLAEETYSVIAEAMRDKGRAAIGRLTLTSRERPVLLRPRDKGMILTTLRSPEELKEEADRLAKIKLREGDDEMVKLAGLIIDKKTGEFDPDLFEDRYQTALRAVIDAKIKGRRPTLKRAAKPAKVVDLFDALKRSLEADPPAKSAPKAAATSPAKATAKTTANAKKAPRKPAASPRRKAS